MSATVLIKPAFQWRSWLRAVWALLLNRPIAYRMAFQDHVHVVYEAEESHDFLSCAFYNGVTVGPPSDETLQKAKKMRILREEMR